MSRTVTFDFFFCDHFDDVFVFLAMMTEVFTHVLSEILGEVTRKIQIMESALLAKSPIFPLLRAIRRRGRSLPLHKCECRIISELGLLRVFHLSPGSRHF
jgi:hypothetical protein